MLEIRDQSVKLCDSPNQMLAILKSFVRFSTSKWKIMTSVRYTSHKPKDWKRLPNWKIQKLLLQIYEPLVNVLLYYLVRGKYLQMTQTIPWLPLLDDKSLQLVTCMSICVFYAQDFLRTYFYLKRTIPWFFRLNDKNRYFVTCVIHAKDFLKEVNCQFSTSL